MPDTPTVREIFLCDRDSVSWVISFGFIHNMKEKVWLFKIEELLFTTNVILTHQIFLIFFFLLKE